MNISWDSSFKHLFTIANLKQNVIAVKRNELVNRIGLKFDIFFIILQLDDKKHIWNKFAIEYICKDLRHSAHLDSFFVFSSFEPLENVYFDGAKCLLTVFLLIHSQHEFWSSLDHRLKGDTHLKPIADKL